MAKKVTVNVITKWGDKKTENSIKISGTTLGDAMNELNQLDEWGEFKGEIGYDYDVADDKVTELRLKPTYTIRMPTWAGYNKAPKACQQEWDRMWAKLQEHEDGHRQIHQDTLDAVEKYFGKATDLTDKQFNAEFTKLIKEGQNNQKKFDTSTGHGSKKGVELVVTEECE
jgi:predicted secreted Zn-dependent protease